MTEMPGAVAEARVMQGSIDVLVVISFALGLLRSYNEIFDVVETAMRNTRRLVEPGSRTRFSCNPRRTCRSTRAGMQQLPHVGG